MATGLPIVASDIEIVKEVVGSSGILVEPTVSGCLKGIREALNSSTEFGLRGMDRAKKYSFERFSNEMAEFYAYLQKKVK